MHHDLMDRINSRYDSLSKGQKRIADYISQHADKAVQMTAARLAVEANVSESTVVRFAALIGYDGYPKMQRALQEMLRIRATSVQRIALTEDMPPQKALSVVLKRDIQNIRRTLEDLNPDVFEQAVQIMVHAKNIYIIGLRSAAPLAEFFGHYLSYIFSNVQIVGEGVTHVMEHLVRVGEEDVVFAMSFPRYSSRTVEAVEFAKRQGAKIVALTDTLISPIASLSDCALIAGSDMALFADSLVAPLSVINALIVALGLAKKEEVSDYLESLEDIWNETETYFEKRADAQ
ncbi:MAG: MurR/RpiR family transcriptional regulator [Clostridia bacterium]|nr:MurR/RpiR family transcriptional regulator [Clostridia bacterium]